MASMTLTKALPTLSKELPLDDMYSSIYRFNKLVNN